MVSRRYEASVAGRSNWVTVQPHWLISGGWLAVLVVALFLTVQTALSILQSGLVANRPALSLLQTAWRVALGAGAAGFLLVRRDPIERAALLIAVVAAGSSVLFGFGLRSPWLSAVRLLSHLTLYALAAIVAWRVVVTIGRELSDGR